MGDECFSKDVITIYGEVVFVEGSVIVDGSGVCCHKAPCCVVVDGLYFFGDLLCVYSWRLHIDSSRHVYIKVMDCTVTWCYRILWVLALRYEV